MFIGTATLRLSGGMDGNMWINNVFCSTVFSYDICKSYVIQFGTEKDLKKRLTFFFHFHIDKESLTH